MVEERHPLHEGKAIFLDRDGVINRTDVRNGKPYAPTRLEDFLVLPGVEEAAHALKEAGYHLIIVTNQPDVGNGKVEKSVVESMNDQLMKTLPLDVVKTCFHKQTDGCSCRKPNPGMLLEAARELDIDLQESFMIGDRAGDIMAGKVAGCQTIFVDHGYANNERTEEADFTVGSLLEAAKKILGVSPDDAMPCNQLSHAMGSKAT